MRRGRWWARFREEDTAKRDRSPRQRGVGSIDTDRRAARMSRQIGSKLTRRRVGPVVAMAVAGPRLFRASSALAQQSTAPQIPKVTVKFAHEPYFDHTQAIIGLKQGWFED